MSNNFKDYLSMWCLRTSEILLVGFMQDASVIIRAQLLHAGSR